jgi:hypothetical protein
MSDLDFLNDEECRAAIARMAAEVAKAWAPDEVELAEIITDGYLERVQQAGRLLYRREAKGVSMGLGLEDIVLLLVLPVLTGFLGNLLAAYSVRTWEELRHRMAAPAAITLCADLLRPLLEREARAIGLTSVQVEQMARLLPAVLTALLLGNANRGGQA